MSPRILCEENKDLVQIELGFGPMSTQCYVRFSFVIKNVKFKKIYYYLHIKAYLGNF